MELKPIATLINKGHEISVSLYDETTLLNFILANEDMKPYSYRWPIIENESVSVILLSGSLTLHTVHEADNNFDQPLTYTENSDLFLKDTQMPTNVWVHVPYEVALFLSWSKNSTFIVKGDLKLQRGKYNETLWNKHLEIIHKSSFLTNANTISNLLTTPSGPLCTQLYT